MTLSKIRTVSALRLLLVLSVAVLVLAALPQHAAPQVSTTGILLTLDPAGSTVHWTLETTLHTVHGSFTLRRGTIRLDPSTGKADGEIVVDAKSGNSGNDSRDKKMHKDVLESERYAEVVFRPDHIEGAVATHGTSTVQLHGSLQLHGSVHEVNVPVRAELTGNHWVGSAKFGVPFIDWGLKNPSNFFLKVNHVVEMEVALKGDLQTLPMR